MSKTTDNPGEGGGSQAAQRLGGAETILTANIQPLMNAFNAFATPKQHNPAAFLNLTNSKKRQGNTPDGSKSKFANTESEIDASDTDDESTNSKTGKYTNTNRIKQLEKENKLLKVDNANMKADNSIIKQQMKSLQDTVDLLVIQVNKTQNPLTPSAPAPAPLFSNIAARNTANTGPTQNEINCLNAFTSERNDIDSREKNVLIMGVMNTTDELAKSKVEEIFAAINIDNNKIQSVYRFKQSTNQKHPPIIKVCLTNKDDRLTVLKASKLLKTSTTHVKVYVNPDLTIAQRNLEKILITERKSLNTARLTSNNEDDKKFYYGIRNGMIKRIQCPQ